MKNPTTIILFFIVGLLIPSITYGQYKDRQQKREIVRHSLPCEQGSFRLLWQDHFNGDVLDTTIWRKTLGNPPPWDCTLPRGECSTELQLYQANNVVVSEGTLKIIAREETCQYSGQYEQAHPCADKAIGDDFQFNFDYSSGIIETKADTIAFKYGRFEVRCRLPKGAGLWPAFWLWGGGGGTGRAGEIDIVEIFDTSQPIFTTSIHNGNKKARQDIPIHWDISEWHTYSIEWTPLSVNYYLDQELIRTYPRFVNNPCAKKPKRSRKRHKRNVAFPWEQWMVLRLNLALNPELGQTVTESTVFPAVMEVDYVKVYEWVE